MSILHLKTNRMIIGRMQTVSGSKQAFSTVTATYGALQPLSAQDSSLADGVFGRTFQFFTDGSIDIQEGDRLKDENNIYYRVKAGGVVRRTMNAIDYLKIICERM